MSIRVMQQVWERSQHCGSSLIVLLAIADHAAEDGTNAYPSLETLATKSRLSKRNVQYILEKLEESGEIAIARGRGRGNTHRFSVLLGGKGEPIAPITEKVKQASTFPQENVQSAATIPTENMQPASTFQEQPEAEKVQSSALKVAIAIAPDPSLTVQQLKESSTNPLLAAAATAREAVERLDSTLDGAPGYEPNPAFLRKVEKYASLDLEEEAIKMLDWINRPAQRKAGRLCSTGYVLSWLKRAQHEPPRPAVNGHAPRAGPAPPVPPVPPPKASKYAAITAESIRRTKG